MQLSFQTLPGFQGRLWCGTMGYEKSPGEPVSSQGTHHGGTPCLILVGYFIYLFSLSHCHGVQYDLITMMQMHKCDAHLHKYSNTHMYIRQDTYTHIYNKHMRPHVQTCTCTQAHCLIFYILKPPTLLTHTHTHANPKGH